RADQDRHPPTGPAADEVVPPLPRRPLAGRRPRRGGKHASRPRPLAEGRTVRNIEGMEQRNGRETAHAAAGLDTGPVSRRGRRSPAAKAVLALWGLVLALGIAA